MVVLNYLILVTSVFFSNTRACLGLLAHYVVKERLAESAKTVFKLGNLSLDT